MPFTELIFSLQYRLHAPSRTALYTLFAIQLGVFDHHFHGIGMERCEFLRRGLWSKVSDLYPTEWIRIDIRFERELERLRKEMELASATGSGSSTTSLPPSNPGTPFTSSSPTTGLDASPLILPEAQGEDGDGLDVPELTLEKAEQEVEKSHDGKDKSL